MSRLRARLGWAEWTLAGILLVALALRLWSIDHGLPFAYNVDEELHFVPVAVEMFGGSFNPGYFENPPALTYLLYLAFKLRFTVGFPFGGDGFSESFARDPESAFLTARVVVALLGTAVVGLVYTAGRRLFDPRVGLIAAALLAVAFLTVFYSKQALNDIVTLVPVTLALVACAAVWQRGRRIDWLLAGVALGAATATKYTAGAMVVTLGAAALLRWRRGDDDVRAGVLGLAIAGVAFVAAYLVLNPYSLIDFSEFRSQLGGQSDQASGAKLGQEDVPGIAYYAWTLTWALGWVPAVAAVAGAVLLVRSEPRKALLLLAFPAFMLLFLGTQGRFFARWILPLYPMLALLAAYAVVRVAELVPARRAWARPAAVVALAAVLCAQGLASSVRSDALLGRTDTRELLREWLDGNVPAGSRVVFEPFIPRGLLASGEALDSPDKWDRYPVARPFQAYERRLFPALVDEYRAGGYCWVVTSSYQRDRGLKEGLENAAAYYERLAAESEQVTTFTPYRPGEGPVEFNFDLSFNYYPRAYLRPGPEIQVHRLRDCEAEPG